jgi:hypothetical protein
MEAAILVGTGHKEEAVEKLKDFKMDNGYGNWELNGIMGEYEACLNELLKIEERNPYGMPLHLVQHYFAFKPLYDFPKYQAMIERVGQKQAEARKQIQEIENASVAGRSPLIIRD